MRQRVVHARPRRLLTHIAYQLTALQLLQLLKYNMAVSGAMTSRLLWYAYYPPLIASSWLSLWCALTIGTSEADRLHPLAGALALPSCVLAALFLTNDQHLLAFSFAGPVRDDALAVYGPLYACGVIWIAGLLVAALVVATLRCARMASRRMVPIALIPILVGTL